MNYSISCTAYSTKKVFLKDFFMEHFFFITNELAIAQFLSYVLTNSIRHLFVHFVLSNY